MECAKNNINKKSESKGILLAIISVILSKYKSISKTYIWVNLTKYKIILQDLFPSFNFVESKTKSNLTICIFTKELGTININYLDQLDQIMGSKVQPIPWFDTDNPVIMFLKTKSQKIQNIAKLRGKIVTWSECDRAKPHGDFDSYDLYIENQVLNKYIQMYSSWSLIQLKEYIRKMLSNDQIVKKTVKKKIHIPVPTPYLMPIPFQDQPQAQAQSQTQRQSIDQDYTDLYNRLKEKIQMVNNSNLNSQQMTQYLIELEKKIEMLNRAIKASNKTISMEK